MTPELREQLMRLKTLAQSSQESELSSWLRELLVQNISKLLEENAPELRVKECLRGGIRAIYDAEIPPTDDPVLILMGAILDA